MTTDDIRFEEKGGIGIVTLDRQKALNALTHPMVNALSARLVEWRERDDISAVLVRAAPGRAFCAGGDIRAVTELAATDGPDAVLPFFRDEYRMNWRIRHFPKPYIALMDGIAMGGGVGISVHGRYRVVTANTVLAMPETGIGMIPDVGGSAFMPRLPGEIGTRLALTGARLDGRDCRAIGIGTHYVDSGRIDELADALIGGDPFDEVLGRFDEGVGNSAIVGHREAIDRLYAGDDLGRVVARMRSSDEEFARKELTTLKGKSPISVGIAFREMRLGRELDFAECLRLEYRLVRHVMTHGDFHEGVRALIIDKDKNPNWQLSSLDEVTDEAVGRFFEPWQGDRLTFDWKL
ncbi:MAG: enoyl-CoA hydratase/isomerase family protein [Geminicoccaceae bacterium]|nr:enoyl-CoA hydratase/isomerase family protein [Geminicoccaceae bacterium]